jgi:hypothetical protein
MHHIAENRANPLTVAGMLVPWNQKPDFETLLLRATNNLSALNA